MIARRWSARATPGNMPRYVRYFRESLTPQLRLIPGYRGATLLERPEGDAIEIQVITWWASMEAIRAFAGDDPSIAVVTEAGSGKGTVLKPSSWYSSLAKATNPRVSSSS